MIQQCLHTSICCLEVEVTSNKYSSNAPRDLRGRVLVLSLTWIEVEMLHIETPTAMHSIEEYFQRAAGRRRTPSAAVVSQGVGGWLEGSQGVGGSVEGSQGVGGSVEGSQGVGGSVEGSQGVGGSVEGSQVVGGSAEVGSQGVGGSAEVGSQEVGGSAEVGSQGVCGWVEAS